MSHENFLICGIFPTDLDAEKMAIPFRKWATFLPAPPSRYEAAVSALRSGSILKGLTFAKGIGAVKLKGEVVVYLREGADGAELITQQDHTESGSVAAALSRAADDGSMMCASSSVLSLFNSLLRVRCFGLPAHGTIEQDAELILVRGPYRREAEEIMSAFYAAGVAVHTMEGTSKEDTMGQLLSRLSTSLDRWVMKSQEVEQLLVKGWSFEGNASRISMCVAEGVGLYRLACAWGFEFSDEQLSAISSNRGWASELGFSSMRFEGV